MFMGGRRGRAAWCLTGARSCLPTVRPAAIHHVSICVPDADAGLAFYRDVIGLTEVAGPDLGPGPGSTPAASRCSGIDRQSPETPQGGELSLDCPGPGGILLVPWFFF